jgi:plasmid maintenance system antidote protein VapI
MVRGIKSNRLPTEWAEDHNVKSKDLVEMLGFTPYRMTEIFKGRKQPTGPTGEKVLTKWS